MSRRDPSLLALASLSPERVNAYARTSGWRPLARRTRQGARIFVHADFEDRQLLLPEDQDVSDYAARLRDLLGTLAETSHRALAEILTEFATFDADILRFAVRSPSTDAGRIPLTAGVDLLEGSRRALLAAACSVLQPQRHHPRMSRAEAEEFLARCSTTSRSRRGTRRFRDVVDASMIGSAAECLGVRRAKRVAPIPCRREAALRTRSDRER